MSAEPVTPHPTLDTFAARLALVRWAQGWNQKEAAIACGLPHSSWRQWELSGSIPRDLVDVAAKISARTGYSDYWIMTGRETPPGTGPRGGTSRELPGTDSNRQPFGIRLGRVLAFPSAERLAA